MEPFRISESIKKEDFVGSGTHGTIYKVSPFYVMKIYHPWVESEASLENEFNIMNKLYNEDRHVPFPVGIFEASVLTNSNGISPKIRKGIVMQHIKGIDGDKVPLNLKKKVEFLYEEELRRCINLNFLPVDAKLKNSLYVPSEDKIYLVDFRLWI